jgi:hypothetical protein
MESPPAAVDALGFRGATGAVGAADWQAASMTRARTASGRRMWLMEVSGVGWVAEVA